MTMPRLETRKIGNIGLMAVRVYRKDCPALLEDVNYRKQKPSAIKAYSNDMSKRQWDFPSQPLAFDCAGKLSDGQQRIAALWDSGKRYQDFLAIYNMPRSAEESFDNGMPRTGSDALHRIGVDKSATLAAAIVRILSAPNYVGQYRRMTHVQLSRYYEFYQEPVSFVLDCWSVGIKRGYTARIKAVWGKAFYTRNHDDLRIAAEKLWELKFSESRDEPLRLLAKIIAAPEQQAIYGSARNIMHKKAEQALYSYLEGTPTKKLRAAKEELFPYPIPPK